MPDYAAVCPDPGFAVDLAARGPFPTIAAARSAVTELVAALDVPRLREIVNGHDPIGVVPEEGFSAGEQAGVLSGDPAVLAEIAALDRGYRDRFGVVFLVHAAGLSATDVRAALRERVTHQPDEEIAVIRAELIAIVTGRLARMIAEPDGEPVR